MTYELRKEKIKELLAENEIVSKKQLEEALGVSPSTVQRDLAAMEKEGILSRLWGGAQRIRDVSLYKRKVEEGNLTGPMRVIGELAASKVQDGELIFLGPGKTTLAMAECITARDITVITNGIPQLEALSRRGINVFLLCGFLRNTPGLWWEGRRRRCWLPTRFDKAFLGIKGFDAVLHPSLQMSMSMTLKISVSATPRETYILADHTKFNRTAMYVTPKELVSYLNIITDRQVEGFEQFAQEKQAYIWKRKGK